MIEIIDVTKHYVSKKQTIQALNHISLRIEEGDIFGIIGLSGAGKSTLIRMINALEKPTEGRVMIGQTNISALPFSLLQKERKKIGMIFQQFNLLNSKTVFDNVAMPLVLNRTPKKKIKEKVDELLHFVELSDQRNQYPDQLSGGQKQRVGIARALATDPSILLSDEATSALDPDTMESILDLLYRINQKLKITIVVVTHQIRVIQKICNKVAVMKEGQIVESGSVFDVFSNPQQTITQNFVRTVIPDQIPASILRTVQKEKNFKIIRMKFFKQQSLALLLYQINTRCPVETRLLHAVVSELGDNPIGIIVLQLLGKDEDIIQAIAFAETQHVICEEVNDI